MVNIICAVCGRVETRPTLQEVYGDDGPFEGDLALMPYADHATTGWSSKVGAYFCPEHAPAIVFRTLSAADAGWKERRAAQLAEVEARLNASDPRPTIETICRFYVESSRVASSSPAPLSE